MSYSSLLTHRDMLFDEQRNTLYQRAIVNNVNSDSIVLDLGSGFGIHGLLAAATGARHVYMVDPAVDAEIIRRIAKLNNLAEKITVFQNKIEECEIPEPVNIIISVFTGNFLFEEDLLPSLLYARDNFLAKDGQLLPDFARQVIVPINCPDIYDKLIASWSTPSNGLDFSPLREYAANNMYHYHFKNNELIFLAEPTYASGIDLNKTDIAECEFNSSVEILRNEICHGMLGWFDIRLGQEWLSTSPVAPATHWRQVFLPLDPPVEVHVGDLLKFDINRPEFGDWSWSIQLSNTTQKHSTFLSRPISTGTLRKKSDRYMANKGYKGEVALFVLEKLDGNITTDALAELIHTQFKSIFPHKNIARRFVIEMIERYG